MITREWLRPTLNALVTIKEENFKVELECDYNSNLWIRSEGILTVDDVKQVLQELKYFDEYGELEVS